MYTGLTKEGEKYLANRVANELPVVFTKVKIGNGHLAGGVNPAESTQLISFKKEIEILEKVQNDNIARLRVLIENSDIESGFFMKELGVYVQDEIGREILYWYVYEDNGQFVYSKDERAIQFDLELLMEVSSNDSTILNWSGEGTWISKKYFDEKVRTFQIANVEEMIKRKNLKVGDIVELLGYYTAGDGAGHKRVIADSDDGSGVQLENGLYANIVHNGEVNVSWFGIEYSGNTSDNNFIFDKTKAFNNYFILQKFSSYTKASRYVIGIQDKIICTMGSCEFRKGNIEIIIDSDIKAIFGSQQNLTDGVQQLGHWLSVIREWQGNSIGYPEGVFHNIIIDGIGSIETLEDIDDKDKHNLNCIGIMNVNDVTIRNVRIPSSIHNGINFDANSHNIKIDNVDIRNCYTLLLKITVGKCPYPLPNGQIQEDVSTIHITNSRFVPKDPRINPLQLNGDIIKIENCVFDGKQNTVAQPSFIDAVAKTLRIENCTFDRIFQIVRINGYINNIVFDSCVMNDCTYVVICNNKPALKYLTIEHCVITGTPYALVGIPQVQEGQDFELIFRYNDLSTINVINWQEITLRNTGTIINDRNIFSNGMTGYIFKPKATAVQQTLGYVDFDLKEILKYRTVFFTMLKANKLYYTSFSTELFLATSIPITIHINEECNLDFQETVNNETLRVTPSNENYKITLIGLS